MSCWESVLKYKLYLSSPSCHHISFVHFISILFLSIAFIVTSAHPLHYYVNRHILEHSYSISYSIYNIVLEPVSFFLVPVTQIHFFWISTVQFLVTTLIHSFLLSKIMIIQHVTSTTHKLKPRSSSISSHITLWISLSTWSTHE